MRNKKDFRSSHLAADHPIQFTFGSRAARSETRRSFVTNKDLRDRALAVRWRSSFSSASFPSRLIFQTDSLARQPGFGTNAVGHAPQVYIFTAGIIDPPTAGYSISGARAKYWRTSAVLLKHFCHIKPSGSLNVRKTPERKSCLSAPLQTLRSFT